MFWYHKATFEALTLALSKKVFSIHRNGQSKQRRIVALVAHQVSLYCTFRVGIHGAITEGAGGKLVQHVQHLVADVEEADVDEQAAGDENRL